MRWWKLLNLFRRIKKLRLLHIYSKFAFLICVILLYIFFISTHTFETMRRNKETYLRLKSQLDKVYEEYLKHEKNIFDLQNPRLIESAQKIRISEMYDMRLIGQKNINRTYSDYDKKTQLDLIRMKNKLPATERPEDRLMFEALSGRASQSDFIKMYRSRLPGPEKKRQALLKYKISAIQNKLAKKRNKVVLTH